MIELRRFSQNDFDDLIGWVTSPHDMLQWSGNTFTYPLNRQQMNRYLHTALRGQRELYTAWLPDGMQRAGHIALTSISPELGSAHISYVLVAPALRGRGIGAAMVRTVLDTAFESYQLHRVDLFVMGFNTGAMSLYRRLGFVEEGRLRESRRDGATYHDVVVMGMLEQEWRASRGG